MECDKKEDPLIFGEDMMGEKLGHTEIKKAQQADEFAQMMVERCSRAGASKDKRASKLWLSMGLFVESQVAAIRKKVASRTASMFRWSCGKR